MEFQIQNSVSHLFSLHGRVVVITGGLGRLGSSLASAFLDSKALVAILDVQDPSPEFYSRFSSFLNDGLLRVFKANIVRRQELDLVLQKLEAEWKVPDVLINNAAIDSPPSAPASENQAFENYPESSFDRIWETNVKGVLLCCQVFGAAMARQSKGSIVNVGSIYGMYSPDQGIYEYKRKANKEWFKPVAYSVTKSALYNLTRYLATYWAEKGIRVNTLTPAGIFANQDPEFLEAYCRKVPMGRMARAEEMQGPVLFLASDASSYMTGANLVVDGGWTAW